MDQMKGNKVNLFIFFDSGEFQMLKGCAKDNLCLCFGVATEQAEKEQIQYISLNQLGVSENVDNKWNRMHPLSQESLLNILQTWMKEQKYKEVKRIISGVASIVQGQLIQLFSRLGLETITVWDNIIPNDNGEYWKSGQQVQHQSGITWFPSQYSYDAMPLKPNKFQIVGHPQIEGYKNLLDQIDADQLKDKLAKSQIVTERIITYTAGWPGDPTVYQGLLFFQQCLKQYSLPEHKIIISYHPKSDRQKEKELFQEFQNVILDHQLSSIEAIKASELILCHKSTIGFSVATVRKLLYIVEDGNYQNPLIQSGVAPIVNQTEQFETQILDLLQNQKDNFEDKYYELLGIRRNSQEFINLLIQNLWNSSI